LTSHLVRFEVIADYCLNFGQFAFYLGSLGTTCDIHLMLIGKRI